MRQRRPWLQEQIDLFEEDVVVAERDLEETGCDQVTLTTFDMRGNELSCVVVTRMTALETQVFDPEGEHGFPDLSTGGSAKLT